MIERPEQATRSVPHLQQDSATPSVFGVKRTPAKQRQGQAGGVFPLEKDLVRAMLRQVEKLFETPGDNLLRLSEVQVGTSLADVVVLRRKRKGWPSFPSQLSILESVCLAWLRHLGTTRIDHLEQRCGLGTGSLRNGQLEKLIECGLVKRGQGGRVQLLRDWSSGIEIVAIEGKLSRWRKALWQATTYLNFADKSYVALPHNRANLVPKIAGEFRRAGVGLLLVSKRGLLKAIEAPRTLSHTWKREAVYSFACRHLES